MFLNVVCPAINGLVSSEGVRCASIVICLIIMKAVAGINMPQYEEEIVYEH